MKKSGNTCGCFPCDMKERTDQYKYLSINEKMVERKKKNFRTKLSVKKSTNVSGISSREKNVNTDKSQLASKFHFPLKKTEISSIFTFLQDFSWRRLIPNKSREKNDEDLTWVLRHEDLTWVPRSILL